MAPHHGNEVEWSVVDYIFQGYWFKHRRLLLLNLCLLIPMMTSVVNGYDSSLLNGLQILPQWQAYFKDPKGKLLGLLGSAQFIGNIVGLPFSPYLSDWYGRRSSLFAGGLLMCLGVALQAASRDVYMYIGARFTVGFGLSFCQNASPLLLTELAYPTQRGKITSMFNSCWYFGSILSAWICLGAFRSAGANDWSWRAPVLFQAVCPIIQLASIWFVPESPRWLVSKGMESKAASILAEYHSQSGDERDPLVMFEMAQIRHAIRMEDEISRSTSYLSLFQTPGNRKRMVLVIAIACFSQWSGNGLVSYYIDLVLEGVGIKNTETKSIINGCLQLYNFVIAMGAAMLVEVAGRRLLFITSNAGMLVTFISWTVATALYNTRENTAAAKAVIPLIFIFYFFYDIAYTPLIVAYCLEILPLRVRAKGFAVMNLVMMATIAFNTFVNSWAIDAIGWWYYVVYCGWLVFELVFVIFFIVETKRRTLEETAALFDGTDHHHDLVVMGGDAAHMSLRLSRVVGGNYSTTLNTAGTMNTGTFETDMDVKSDVHDDYFEMKRRYRDSDITYSMSADLNSRGTS